MFSWRRRNAADASTAAFADAVPAVVDAARGLAVARQAEPSDREFLLLFIPALLASAVLHILLLVLFALVPVSQGRQSFVREIHSSLAEELEPIEPPKPLVTVAAAADEPQENLTSAEALSIAAAQADEDVPLLDPIEPTQVEPAPTEVALDSVIEGFKMDEVLVNAGGAGEEIATVDGAVDRITHEIAANLELGNVLVVWLMDASISLHEERGEVADRLERIYAEIEELEVAQGDALLTSVVRFGQDHEEMVRPTVDGDAILEAIRNVPADESGVENVFSAIVDSVNLYKPYRTRDRRKLMFVVWTDESGDDLARLEDAVNLCRKGTIPVFVVGPSAMFGQVEGTQAYRHPDDGVVYQLPVNRGPDSARAERLRIAYWFGGAQHESLHSGLGPYALTRLASASGGAYFVNESALDRSPFRLTTMARYMPEYGSAAQYTSAVRQSALRQAVLRAVDATRDRELKGTPRQEFAPTGETFQQELREAQETVAYNKLSIEAALAAFGSKGMEKEYRAEKSPRWRAWYDLTLGRLLAMQVRCDEYNVTCAEMKAKGAEFVDKKSNRWRFEPDAKLRTGTATERQAAEATRLLKRCVEENAGTPWELLAQRELEHPFGFVVREAYVAPPKPPPMADQPSANRPLGRREEQMRELDRKKEVKLPKL